MTPNYSYYLVTTDRRFFTSPRPLSYYKEQEGITISLCTPHGCLKLVRNGRDVGYLFDTARSQVAYLTYLGLL